MQKNIYKLLFWCVSIFTAVLRLSIIGKIGLSGDEAHYWTYTQYLNLSYFDHPPAVAYVIKFFTLIFGNTEFAVRFPTVLIFFITSFLIFKLAEEFYGQKAAFWSIVLLNVTPVFSFLGAVLTIPDAPLSLFWMLYIYVFWMAVKKNTAGYWYILGCLLGLGLLSKYNAVLLIPSTLLFLLCSKRSRNWLLRKEPYIALIIAAGIIFLPVIIWNLQNNMASFGFQMKHGFGNTIPKLSFALLAKCLGAQAGYISPLLFFVYWFVLFQLGWQYIKQKDDKYLLLFSFSFPTLFLFNAIASFNEILPHWPAMGYLILAIPAADLTIKMWDKTWFKFFSVSAWVLALFLTILVPIQAMYKILPPEKFLPKNEAVKIEDGITKAEKIDITNELYGWREVGKKIAEIIEKSPEPKPFIFTHRHYIASQLSFYVPGNPRIFCLSDRIDAYDFWQRDLSSLNGRDGIFVTNDYFYIEPENIYPFKSWKKFEPLEIFRSGRKARIFWITYGKKFNLKDLKPEYTSIIAGQYKEAKTAIIDLDHKIFWIINKKFDVKIINYLMHNLTKFDISSGINSGMVFLIALTAFVLWKTRREHFFKEFVLAISILIVGGIIVHLIKYIVDRLRPLALFGNQTRTFYEQLTRGSFPSGHTQIAFSAATYLTSRLKKYWWLFFGIAVCIGLSRIYIGVHFPLDVAGGAITGTLVALIMIKLIKIK